MVQAGSIPGVVHEPPAGLRLLPPPAAAPTGTPSFGPWGSAPKVAKNDPRTFAGIAPKLEMVTDGYPRRIDGSYFGQFLCASGATAANPDTRLRAPFSATPQPNTGAGEISYGEGLHDGGRVAGFSTKDGGGAVRGAESALGQSQYPQRSRKVDWRGGDAKCDPATKGRKRFITPRL